MKLVDEEVLGILVGTGLPDGEAPVGSSASNIPTGVIVSVHSRVTVVILSLEALVSGEGVEFGVGGVNGKPSGQSVMGCSILNNCSHDREIGLWNKSNSCCGVE